LSWPQVKKERLLPLPGGGVNSQNIVHELHELGDSEWIVLELRQAKVGGVQESVNGLEGEVPGHYYPGEATEGPHGVLQSRHLRDFLHVFTDGDGSVVVRQHEFPGRPRRGAKILRTELFEAEILGSRIVGLDTTLESHTARETYAG
jgi:hypothetical protein